MRRAGQISRQSFSLVEVVLAIGIVSFSVLTTFGLLSVANDTNKKARDEGFAARLAANEFDRLRSLSSANFPTTYNTRYFDANLKDLGTSSAPPGVVYSFSVQFLTAPSGTADTVLTAQVKYPAKAASPNVVNFTTLVNTP